MDGALVLHSYHTLANFVDYKLIDESNSDKNFGFRYYCFVLRSQKELKSLENL